MLYCHTCKLDPSTVAHFDLTLPESSTERPLEDLVFSGYIEMSFCSGDPILETVFDVFPVLVLCNDSFTLIPWPMTSMALSELFILTDFLLTMRIHRVGLRLGIRPG